MPVGATDWLRRADDKKQAAASLLPTAPLAREVWELCGKGAEFALKALIMRYERLNEWPERSSRPELHTHGIRQLIVMAGVDLASLTPKQAASFLKACEWRREHDYEVHAFPHRDAKDMFEATFGPDGVLEWVRLKI